MIRRIALKDSNNNIDDSNYPTFYLGTNKKISDNIHMTSLTVPIVTYTAENTFSMDLSATETYDIPYERTNNTEDGNTVSEDEIDPETGDVKAVTRTMNNREWITEMRKRINHWQARHDGFQLVVDGDNNFPAISQNGYLKSFSVTYKCGDPEHITGNISFQSGSMRCRNSQNVAHINSGGKAHTISETTIIMSSADESAQYTLFCMTTAGTEYGCVSSYTLTYGPTEPFPLLKMTISRKRLMNIAPDLVGNIVAGKNRVCLNACGKGNFIVTKCSSNKQNYIITAYAFEEMYCGIKLNMKKKLSDFTPKALILDLLTSDVAVGDRSGLFFSKDNIVFHYRDNYDKWEDAGSMEFGTDQTYWYVLSVCALKLNCSIWFADGKAYIVDLTKKIEATNNDMEYFNRRIFLNSVPNSPDASYPEAIAFCKNVQGEPTLGDEGADALTNVVEINCNKYQNTVMTIVNDSDVIIKESYIKFGERTGNTYSIPEISVSDGQFIANHIPIRTADTQQSITFTLSEMSFDGVLWQPYFPQAAQVKEIVDHNTDTLLTNISTFYKRMSDRLYGKLCLSCVTRKFPEFSSEYTFGRIANTDLSQTTSVIQQAVGNR